MQNAKITRGISTFWIRSCHLASAKLFSVYLETTTMVLWWCMPSNQLQVFRKAKTIFLKTIGFGIRGMSYGTKGMYYEDQSLQTWEKMYSFWYVFARWMIRYVEDKQYPTISGERSHEANAVAKSNDLQMCRAGKNINSIQ